MYLSLSRVIKKRLVEELKLCFDQNPRHRDIVENIKQKYDFSERPQKGIVLESSNVSPQPLSSDNYMGSLQSYVMKAGVDAYAGSFLAWVREDTRRIEESGGFPSPPGVYYIQLEENTLPGEVPEFQFWVDPLITVLEEEVYYFEAEDDGEEEIEAFLDFFPALEASVHLYAYPNYPLMRGKALKVTGARSIFFGEGAEALGFGQGYVPVVAVGTQEGPYEVEAGVNDEFVFTLEGVSAVDVAVRFPTEEGVPSKVYEAEEVALLIEKALGEEAIRKGVHEDDYEVDVTSEGKIKIKAPRSLRIGDGTANDLLGFEAGHVGVMATGTVVRPYVEEDVVVEIRINGDDYTWIPAVVGRRKVGQIAEDLNSFLEGVAVGFQTVDGGDYVLDAENGKITFLNELPTGTRVIADYKYPSNTVGPFKIGQGDVATNKAIPGVVVAFNNQLEDEDIAAVVVSPQREDAADVYGGKASMSLDFTIMARDSMTRNELADLVVAYLWQWRREHLAEEGIILESVSFGGESEEPYDDVGGDFYYLASISVSLMTDWEVYVEKPLTIRRVTASSYEQEVERAKDGGGGGGGPEEGLKTYPEDQIKEFGELVRKRRAHKYERLM